MIYLSGKTKKTVRSTRFLFFLFFMLPGIIFFKYCPLTSPVLTNPSAKHYCIAQGILSGGILYKDFYSNKPPVLNYLMAGSFYLCNNNVISSIILFRLVLFCIFLMSSVMFFYFVKEIFDKEFFVFLTLMIFFSYGFIFSSITSGNQWQILMTCFGLMCLFFYSRQKLLLCGFSAGLAFLTWMPGLVFLISPIVTILKFEKRKASSLYSLLAGFFIPVFIIFSIFIIRGNFYAFFRDTIIAGYSYIKAGWFDGLQRNIIRSLKQQYLFNIPVVIMGFIGFCMSFSAICRKRALNANCSNNLFLVGFSLGFFLIISFINFQQGFDFIPLIPWLCVYAVFFLVSAATLFKSKIMRLLIFSLFYSSLIYSFFSLSVGGGNESIEQQRRDVLNLFRKFRIDKEDCVFADRASVYLLFSGNKNIVRYYESLSDTHYQIIERIEEQGFNYILYSIRDLKPKLIIIRKAHIGPGTERLFESIEADYIFKEENKERLFFVRRNID